MGVFFFKSRHVIVGFCLSATTCTDYVEIRTNLEAGSTTGTPGMRFCACGVNSGRAVTFDGDSARVLFRTLHSANGGDGFKLVVYATCGDTKASTLDKECVITSTGYDYEGSKATTADGAACEAWPGNADPFSFPRGVIADSANFCRNPSSIQNGPWCYTSVVNQVAAQCSVPQCPTA